MPQVFPDCINQSFKFSSRLLTNWLRTVFLFLLLVIIGRAAGAAEATTGLRYNLDQLIAKTLQSHPSIASKRSEFGAAKAEIEAARWQYYPTPSIQVQQVKEGASTVVALQQPLWTGGRLDAGMDVANSKADSANVSITDAQYTLALRVDSAYQAWMQAHGRGVALAEGVALLNIYAESVVRRIGGGVSSEADRELVVARLAQTQGDLAAASAAERSALAQLSQMAGQTLREKDLAFPNDSEDPLPGLDELVNQAILRYPGLRRIETDIETAQHEISQKRAALWPTANLRAEHQHVDSTTPGVTANDSRLMLVLEYAPGAGLSTGARIAAAEAHLNGLRENREAAKRELIEKISADYEDHLSSRSRKQDIQRSIKASTEVLASYDRLFVAGKRGWLDVINAARELTQVQVALADVEALRVVSRHRLRLHAGEIPWAQGN